jgi:AraC family transcriptional regulator
VFHHLKKFGICQLRYNKRQNLWQFFAEHYYQYPEPMLMEPKMTVLTEKMLVGKKMTMSLLQNRTQELWQQFMRARKDIPNLAGDHKFSLQQYAPGHFEQFSPATEFVKWAAMEVTNFDSVPEGMETLVLPGGLYAVFQYKGSSSAGAQVFGYIFGEWLPKSDYVLDDRPHFELLGEKYRNDDADSEEEIWVPVRG